MKVAHQVALYFMIVLVVVTAGFGFMLNRIHKMDVAHHRLIQEWKELQLITTFLNDIDQLITDISLSSGEDFVKNGVMARIDGLVRDLEEVRNESLQAEEFEEKEHVDKEKLEFVEIYDGFQAFIHSADRLVRNREAAAAAAVKPRLVAKLNHMREAGNTLQDYYIEQMGEATAYARRTRQQLLERAVVVSGAFVVMLAVMAFWFIYQVNKSTAAMVEKEKHLTIGLLAQSLSHEIRNPLGIIKTSTSVIRKKLPPGSEEYEIAGYLDEEVNRIDDLIGQLSKLREDSPRRMAAEDPAAIIQQVILLLTGVSQKTQVSINFLNDAGPCAVWCDRNQIKQVLINIILNALQASPPQDTVTLTARTDQKMYILEVRDNGPGFARDETARVFQPFYTTKKNGSGLGLYVARTLAASNGGFLRVEPSAGRGGVVTVGLRLGPQKGTA